MTGRRFYVYALIAAILPALAITLPTSKAEAKDGRNAAFVAGLVVGAVGGAAIYSHSQSRWRGVRNHYHRGYYGRCHTHNGVRHCHSGRSYVPTYRKPARVYYDRPQPWTRAWYRYCTSKFRSFNPRTGYYTTYSGRKRFCR